MKLFTIIVVLTLLGLASCWPNFYFYSKKGDMKKLTSSDKIKGYISYYKSITS